MDGAMVVSHAYLLPGSEHAAAYIQAWKDYDHVLAAQPGFRGRWLVQGAEDPSHLTHLRWWDRVADYTALTQRDDYSGQIARLSEHIDAAKYADGYPREFTDVVLHTPPVSGT